MKSLIARLAAYRLSITVGDIEDIADEVEKERRKMLATWGKRLRLALAKSDWHLVASVMDSMEYEGVKSINNYYSLKKRVRRLAI
jgi:hypothetical protein